MKIRVLWKFLFRIWFGGGQVYIYWIFNYLWDGLTWMGTVWIFEVIQELFWDVQKKTLGKMEEFLIKNWSDWKIFFKKFENRLCYARKLIFYLIEYHKLLPFTINNKNLLTMINQKSYTQLNLCLFLTPFFSQRISSFQIEQKQ